MLKFGVYYVGRSLLCTPAGTETPRRRGQVGSTEKSRALKKPLGHRSTPLVLCWTHTVLRPRSCFERARFIKVSL